MPYEHSACRPSLQPRGNFRCTPVLRLVAFRILLIKLDSYPQNSGAVIARIREQRQHRRYLRIKSMSQVVPN